MKPLMPFWQKLLASLLFVGGVGGFSVLESSLWSVVLSLLLLVGIAVVVAIYLRNKEISVTLTFGNDSVQIKDPARPGYGKLTPVRVEQISDSRVFVERNGGIWQVKRFELNLASPEDTAKTVTLLRQLIKD